MTSDPLLAANFPRSIVLGTLVLLLSTSGFAQQDLRYRATGRAGTPSPVLPTVIPLPLPLPAAIQDSERPAPGAEPEEVWTPSPYRVSGATYLVINTNDAGAGSLRQAILDANANPGQDMIAFLISGTGVQTISPYSQLPTIIDPVIIDGATQSGYIGQPLIELNGANAGTGKNGLVITGGGSIVRGLVINRFVSDHVSPDALNGLGIVLDQIGGNCIQGCYIGLNAAGTGALGNEGGGIAMFGGATRNLIGGTAAAERNVISGNGGDGIQDSSGGNRIINNYIGLSAAGDLALGNLWNGIYVAALGDTIGGRSSSERNVISGNGWPAVALDTGAMRTLIQGNYFGTDVTKLHGLGNGNEAIYVNGSYNTIGGPSLSARNRIYASNLAGIAIDGSGATGNVVQGNCVGPAESFVTEMQNSIGIWVHDAPGNTIGGTVDSAGNLVTLNALYGIEISGEGATGNVVQGNRIGGNSYVGSGNGNWGYGLMISNAPGNMIGGTAPYAPNFIQGNLRGGIFITGNTATGNIIKGNYIGPDINRAKGSGKQSDGIILAASGNRIGGTDPYEGNTIAYNKGCGIFDSTGTANSFLGNLIYSNDSLGIDLAPRGVTPNDSLDEDAGANGLQNFPILDSADIGPGSVRIRGRMIGIPGASYSLEFFLNDGPSTRHFGQGKTFLGEGSAVCDGTGNGDINVSIAVSMRMDQYITATATGTDASTSEFSRELCMLDGDGDGILDMWETAGNGIDWNCDGVIDLDLYRMGASKDHKDLFVEVDHMLGCMPDTKSLIDVEIAFRSIPNAYVNNPDGNNGVNLFTELDAGSVPIAHAPWGADPWPEFLAVKKTHFGTDTERGLPNGKNIIEAKRLVYRYCIFADTYGTKGSSGMARVAYGGDVSNDFLVTLGEFATFMSDREKRVMFESGTFMHELGHTLSLRHGGGDEINYKPNYYSVMNYLFQMNVQDNSLGVVLPKDTWKLNYSPTALQTLSENQPHELPGLNPPAGVYDVVLIPYTRPNDAVALALLSPGTPVDWDGNGDSSGYATGPVDLNYFGGTASPGEILRGYADLTSLKYNFRNSPSFAAGAAPPAAAPRKATVSGADELEEEITPTQYQRLKQLPPFGIIERKSSWSQSSLENIPIATNPSQNGSPQIVTDGHRGAIISWDHGEETWSPVYDMRGNYAQRIDSLGQAHWQNNGVGISLGRRFAGSRAITPDGEGGAIITWIVWVNPLATNGPLNLCAQRIDANGNLLWQAAGVDIVTNGTAAGGSMITSDGKGGAIIAWETTTGTICAQRVNSSGIPLWSSGGVLVGMYNYPNSPWGNPGSALAHDPESGTVILWQTGASSGVHAQRIDTSGSVRWGGDGILLSATGGYSTFVLPAGGGQAFAAWTDTRVGAAGIYAQRLDTAGTFRWGGTGLPVDVTLTSKTDVRLVPDGKGGVIAAWFDNRNYPPLVGVFGQRISGTGTLLWPSTSVCFADSVGSSVYLAPVSDLKGGVILVYAKRIGSSFTDIFAQHVDSAGAPQWGENGVAVCSAGKDQYVPVAISDGVGGAITAWTDLRRSTTPSSPLACVFAQLVNRTGGLGGTLVTAVAERPSAVPESFRLFQNYPNPFNPSTTIEYDLPVPSKVVIRIYDILGRQVQELTNGIEPAGRIKLVWNPQNRLASGVYFCRIEVISIGSGAATQNRVLKMLLLR